MLLARTAVFMLFALVATACVTINIYFPEAQAEEAAREIVRDVLEPAAKQLPKGDKESAIPRLHWQIANRILNAVVAPAQAASPNININTPAIAKIRARMKSRQGKLKPFYRSGAIGFGNNADIALRDLKAVALPKRGLAKKLVGEENADRAALYREIARANKHPEWEKDIRMTFARVWVQEAPKGYWYQDAKGKWKKK